jgi:cell division protein FtsW
MMFTACFVMYFIAGAKWRDIGIMVIVGLVAGGGLILARPYLLSRVQVFLDPSRDPLGTSYQVQQQLIALGSGQITGRGFGQSVQKFKYLPEPMSDSIFSVIGEELGFLGVTIIITLYLLFFLRGMLIARRLKDPFSKYLVVGIVSTISFQVFLNIASNAALFPLSGLPLIFMSQGGTALAFAIGSLGLVLNASRFQVLPQTHA